MLGYTKPDPMDDQVLRVAPVQFPYRSRSRTTLLVIHDSHTPPSVRLPLEHLRWQGRKRGLLDIGYHLIIDRSGGSHLVRPITAIGSHTPRFNHTSIGICLVGGLTEEGNCVDNFTVLQRQVLTKYCAGFMTEFPEAQIAGHSEVQRWKGETHRCPWTDMNLIRLDAQAFKFEGNRTRTLSEMVASKTYRTQTKRVTHDERQTQDADSIGPDPAGTPHP